LLEKGVDSLVVLYDVVVIGGGPAGLVAARKTSSLGLRTIVLEKESQIGVPLSCGEFLPSPETMLKLLPKVDSELQFLFDIPQQHIDQKIEKIRVVLEGGGTWEFPFDSFSINRSSWEQQLAKDCETNGVEFLFQSPAKGFSNSGVKVQQGDSIRGRVYIAADGPSSKMARWANLSVDLSPSNLSSSFGYQYQEVDYGEPVVDMYFGPHVAPGGYAWIIPKGEGVANVGVGIRNPFVMEGYSLRRSFDSFIKNPLASKKLARAKSKFQISGLIPVGGPLPKTYSDNLMVVGDAAGMVMASNGGGIPTGIVTGWLAGKTAADHLEHDSPLVLYETRWKSQIGKVLNTALTIRKMLDRFMNKPKLMKRLMTIAGSRRIGEMIQCRIPLLIALGYRLGSRFL
jgi:geranylgeranyl reductase family protein